MRVDYTGHCLNALLIMDDAGLLGKTEAIQHRPAEAYEINETSLTEQGR
jgi:hypothetical protein